MRCFILDFIRNHPDINLEIGYFRTTGEVDTDHIRVSMKDFKTGMGYTCTYVKDDISDDWDLYTIIREMYKCLTPPFPSHDDN